MVDVGDKPATHRVAVAEGRICMQPETLKTIMESRVEKGDVLAIAQVAGIMATKRTSDLVPLCHPLNITSAEVDMETRVDDSSVYCRATVKTSGQTGVEMEALTAVQIALLTVYDMCKAIDRGMVITGVGLLEKSGGKSGTWRRGKEKDSIDG